MKTNDDLGTRTTGSGPKVLLVHGLGGNGGSWSPLITRLAAEREVITIDLPGHGETPAHEDSGTFLGLADDLQAYIERNGLTDTDIAGFSLGGRLVLEMARRGCVRNVVALNPGGFWQGWERNYFKWTLSASKKLLKALEGQLGALSHSSVSRTALLPQLSARPWSLDGDMVEAELVSFATTSTVVPLIRDLAESPAQSGPASPHTGRITIVWGGKDRLCLPRQASRARAAFPDAQYRCLESSGHYSIWDEPEEVLQILLAGTGTDRT